MSETYLNTEVSASKSCFHIVFFFDQLLKTKTVQTFTGSSGQILMTIIGGYTNFHLASCCSRKYSYVNGIKHLLPLYLNTVVLG